MMLFPCRLPISKLAIAVISISVNIAFRHSPIPHLSSNDCNRNSRQWTIPPQTAGYRKMELILQTPQTAMREVRMFSPPLVLVFRRTVMPNQGSTNKINFGQECAQSVMLPGPGTSTRPSPVSLLYQLVNTALFQVFAAMQLTTNAPHKPHRRCSPSRRRRRSIRPLLQPHCWHNSEDRPPATCSWDLLSRCRHWRLHPSIP